MSNLSNDIDNFKKKYRKIFLNSSELISEKIEKIKPHNACSTCSQSFYCADNCAREKELFEEFPQNCEYKKWQREVINLFDNEIMPYVHENWTKMYEYRDNFGCNGCATCCRLACSEFSPSELQEKASKGDNFATQFVSVFIPYESEDEARKIYPE